jgi:hypothetical protein
MQCEERHGSPDRADPRGIREAVRCVVPGDVRCVNSAPDYQITLGKTPGAMFSFARVRANAD